MNILDIIILAVIGIFVYIGLKKGAVETLFSLASYFVAAVITYLYHGLVKTVLIDMTGIDESVTQFVTECFKALGANTIQATVTSSELDAMQAFPLPEAFRKAVSEFLTSKMADSTQSVVSMISDYIMSVIAMITLFLIVLIALKIIASMLDLVAKLPVIRTFNALGGGIFGALKAYIIISVVFLVAITFFSLHTNPALQEMINSSIGAKFFINYNVFMLWFTLIPQ